MYISGAKFEDHCSNISGDILNSIFYRHNFPHLHNTKTGISLKRKKIFQKGKTPLFFTLKSLSNKEQ